MLETFYIYVATNKRLTAEYGPAEKAFKIGFETKGRLTRLEGLNGEYGLGESKYGQYIERELDGLPKKQDFLGDYKWEMEAENKIESEAERGRDAEDEVVKIAVSLGAKKIENHYTWNGEKFSECEELYTIDSDESVYHPTGKIYNHFQTGSIGELFGKTKRGDLNNFFSELKNKLKSEGIIKNISD